MLCEAVLAHVFDSAARRGELGYVYEYGYDVQGGLNVKGRTLYARERSMWFNLRKEDLRFLSHAPVVHSCSVEITAPRAAVFAAVAAPETWCEWFPGVRAARYASPPPYGTGTRREAHVGGTRWDEELIAWETDKRWAYTVTRSSVPFARAQVESFDFEDSGTGTCLRWTLALEPRLIARLGAPFTSTVITRLFRQAAFNLERHLQGAAAVPPQVHQ